MTITQAETWPRRTAPAAAERGPAAAATEPATGMADAVRAGLLRARKRLPPWLLYDQVGSALFEEITALPEYYLTRTERAILETYAAEMIEAAGPPLAVAELGAGTAAKTQLLLAALLARQPRASYMPVDVSPTALALAEAELARFRRLTVQPVVARYPEDLDFLDGLSGRRLLLFLGSNIGNYDAPAARRLLRGVRRHLAPGDACLIGTDLHKSGVALLPAYDDAQGVTARFNKNVLARINRELGATFDLDRFRHVVRWNRSASRVELGLASVGAQRVAVRALGVEVRFADGERIHTESSYKFTRTMIRDLFADAGLRLERTWTDPRRWFGVHLARVPTAGRGRPRGRARVR